MRARVTYLNNQPIQPPTSLYLGIRAARRALRDNPEDGPTYLQLGQAYERLAEQPQERTLRVSAQRFLLLDIRRTQMVAAFNNSLRLKLNLDSEAQAHESLFKVYDQLRYIDTAVHHLRGALDSARQQGRRRALRPRGTTRNSTPCPRS